MLVIVELKEEGFFWRWFCSRGNCIMYQFWNRKKGDYRQTRPMKRSYVILSTAGVNFITYLTQGYARLLLNIPLEGIPSTVCLWSIIHSLSLKREDLRYVRTAKVIIYKSQNEPFLGNRIWDLAIFGPVGCTEYFGPGRKVSYFFMVSRAKYRSVRKKKVAYIKVRKL